jgi:hypothetical protein
LMTGRCNLCAGRRRRRSSLVGRATCPALSSLLAHSTSTSLTPPQRCERDANRAATRRSPFGTHQ